MGLACKSAAAAGVRITTIRASLEDFDYGIGRWDLIVGTYVGVGWLEAAAKALKPGGFLVVEGYAKHPQAPAGAAFGPNELLKMFRGQNLQTDRCRSPDNRSLRSRLGKWRCASHGERERAGAATVL